MGSGMRLDYKTKPLQAKESYKWMRHFSHTRTPEGVEESLS